MSLERKRIDWIDLARGIAILLVIVGHTLGRTGTGVMVNNVIYSFHMPLFFLLSMSVYRSPETFDEWKASLHKSAKRLLLPVGIVFVVTVCNELISKQIPLMSYTFWRSQVYRLVFSSGVWLSYEGVEIPELGAAWFLVVLFLGRALFDLLKMAFSEKQIPVICLVLGLFGVLYGQSQKLVFSLDVVLAVQPLLYAGTKFLPFVEEHTGWKQMLGLLLLYLVTLWIEVPDPRLMTGLQLSARHYSLVPLSYITAWSGSALLCMILKCMQDGKMLRPLCRIGQASMDLFVIHCLDILVLQLWQVETSEWRSAVLRLAVNLVVFGLVQAGRGLLIKNK